MKRLSAIILVDPRGWVLLQERDGSATVAPDSWGMVGGEVEGDEMFEAAAYRELAEETELVLRAGLTLWAEESWAYPGAAASRYAIWAGATSVGDRDLVVHEGRKICFVPPSALDALPLGGSAAFFVPRFVASRLYEGLAQRSASVQRSRST